MCTPDIEPDSHELMCNIRALVLFTTWRGALEVAVCRSPIITILIYSPIHFLINKRGGGSRSDGGDTQTEEGFNCE